MRAIGAQDADDGGDIGIVAAMADGDVVGTSDHLVGGVELHPAQMLAAPGAHPGMHGVGAFKSWLAFRGNGAQEARHIACRNAKAAQAGDHHMGEVLTDAFAQSEGLGRAGFHIRRLGIVGKVTIDSHAERIGLGQNRVSRRRDLGSIVGNGRDDLHAGRGSKEMLRAAGLHRPVAADFERQRVKRGRQVIQRRDIVDLHPGGQTHFELVMGLDIDERSDGIAEEIEKALLPMRPGGEGERGGHHALGAGHAGRGDANMVASAMHGRGIVIFEGQAHIVEHGGHVK